MFACMYVQMTRGIIFCRTNVDCNNLERFLKNAGDTGSENQLAGKNSKAKVRTKRSTNKMLNILTEFDLI